MAKIVSVKDLREYLGYDDTTQVNECISKALDSATLYIESILSTSLSLISDNEDIYDAQEYREKTSKGGRGSLRLANGFVDDTTIVVSTSASLYVWTDQVLADSKYVFTKAEKGVVYLDIANLEWGTILATSSSIYIKIIYTSGFATDASGVFKGTPEWMKESARFIARELYRTDDEEVDMGGDLGAMRLLERHIRQYAMTVTPIT